MCFRDFFSSSRLPTGGSNTFDSLSKGGSFRFFLEEIFSIFG
jgi:hypothetical protein